MRTDLLQNGSATTVLAAAGLVLVVVAFGAWVGRGARRVPALLGLAGILVVALSFVLGWLEASRDADRLRGALQDRGVTVSLDQARDIRRTLDEEGRYASAVGAAQAWRLTLEGDDIVLHVG